MRKKIIKEEEIIVCDYCDNEEKYDRGEILGFKMDLRTPKETHYHIHEVCLTKLLDKNYKQK